MPCRSAKVRSRATSAALRASFAGQKWSTTHATRAGSNTPLAPIFSNSWIETAPETSLSITRSIRAKANAPGVRSSTPCAARIFADSVIGPSIPSLRSWEVQRTSWTRRGAPREDAGTCVCTSSSWGLGSWGRRSRCGSPRTARGSTLLDAGEPGAGTSSTSFAWIGASAAALRDYRALNVAGVAAYARLEAELGPRPWLRRTGSLVWHTDPERCAELASQVAALADMGYAAALLDPEQALALEPSLRLAPGVEHVAFHADEGHADGRRMAAELAARAVDAGAELRTGAEVTGVDDGAVTLATGERLVADAVVLCAGRWTGCALRRGDARRGRARRAAHRAARDDRGRARPGRPGRRRRRRDDPPRRRRRAAPARRRAGPARPPRRRPGVRRGRGGAGARRRAGSTSWSRRRWA